MVKKCIFPSCKNIQIKKSDEDTQHIQFHSFPIGREDVLSKWIEAVGRKKDWRPGKASRVCSVHFSPECFKPTKGPRKLLIPDAIPQVNVESNGICKLSLIQDNPDCSGPSHIQTGVDPDVKSNVKQPSKIQEIKNIYNKKLKEMQRKNKILKLRMRRRDLRIKELKLNLSRYQKNNTYGLKCRQFFDKLEGFTKELVEHNKRNLDTKKTGIRYSISLREFALTLYLHSPRAYYYVRSKLKLLPNPSLIKKWISNFNKTQNSYINDNLNNNLILNNIIIDNNTENNVIIDNNIIIENNVILDNNIIIENTEGNLISDDNIDRNIIIDSNIDSNIIIDGTGIVDSSIVIDGSNNDDSVIIEDVILDETENGSYVHKDSKVANRQTEPVSGDVVEQVTIDGIESYIVIEDSQTHLHTYYTR